MLFIVESILFFWKFYLWVSRYWRLDKGIVAFVGRASTLSLSKEFSSLKILAIFDKSKTINPFLSFLIFVKWVRDWIPQLKTHERLECKKFKFWRHWLVSAGQADGCTRGRARTYLLISMSLYNFSIWISFLKNDLKVNSYWSIWHRCFLHVFLFSCQVRVALNKIKITSLTPRIEMISHIKSDGSTLNPE